MISMKRDDVDAFEKLISQLEATHQEVSALARKSPTGGVNPFKLKFINQALEQCNNLLGKRYRPFPDFDSFSLDDVPSNSDVSFIVAQYLECAEKFRADHIVQAVGDVWYWAIAGEEKIRAAPPKKLTKKPRQG